MPSPAKTSAATAKKSAPAAKAAPAAEAKSAPKAALTPAERMKMIAEAAYFMAEKRGFSGGSELSDWVAAEKQVDAQLSKRG